MEAIIYINRGNGNFNPSHRKENAFIEEHCAIDRKSGAPIVTLRIYGTNARNYACVWVNSVYQDIYLHGSGYAGGYGYHRPSQAAENAFKAANIEFSARIGGCGDQLVTEAVRAVASELGYSDAIIHRAHS